MPKFYHIHRSPKPIKEFKEGTTLFFAPKNQFWNRIEKSISADFGGYVEYEINLPQKCFTTSLNPRSRNKILKVTQRNVKDYKKILEMYPGKTKLINHLKTKFAGFDTTDDFLRRYKDIDEEGAIWDFSCKGQNITISEIEKIN